MIRLSKCTPISGLRDQETLMSFESDSLREAARILSSQTYQRTSSRSGWGHTAERIVVGVLQELLKRFETSLGDARDPGPNGPVADRREDEAYVYLKLRLSHGVGLEIDLNVHEDRVLIRATAPR